MKKSLLIIVLFITFFITSAFALNHRTELQFDDLSTRNFEEKMEGISPYEIKSICSYDYCEYVYSDSYKDLLENFTKSYLNTIKDEELVASLRVKGIKITRIIFQN